MSDRCLNLGYLLSVGLGFWNSLQWHEVTHKFRIEDTFKRAKMACPFVKCRNRDNLGDAITAMSSACCCFTGSGFRTLKNKEFHNNATCVEGATC